jgi:hypothetical protein
MNDRVVNMPSVYGSCMDTYKPGEGHMNEEYARFNYNTYAPYTGETVKQFYEDTHMFRKSIYNTR